MGNILKTANEKLQTTPNNEVVKIFATLNTIRDELTRIDVNCLSITKQKYFRDLFASIHNSKLSIENLDKQSYNKHIDNTKQLSNQITILAGSSVKGASLPNSFWIEYVYMCRRLNVDPYNMAAVINLESAGFDSSAQSGPNAARGFNQLIYSTAKSLGISDNLWKNFAKLPPEESLKWTEKYFRRFGGNLKGKDIAGLYKLNLGGHNNPDGSLYASLAVQNKYIQDHPGAKFNDPKGQDNAVRSNPGLVENGVIGYPKLKRVMERNLAAIAKSGIRDKIDEAIATIGDKPTPPFQEPDPNFVVGESVPQVSNEFVPVQNHREVSELAQEKQHEWFGKKPVGYIEVVNWKGKTYKLKVAPHNVKGATGYKIDPQVFQAAKDNGFPLSEAGKSWLYAVEVYEQKNTSAQPAQPTQPIPSEIKQDQLNEVYDYFTSLSGGVANNTENDSTKELEPFLNMFGLASETKPLTQIVINAISNNELPQREVLIKINSLNDRFKTIKYAEDLGESLVSALDGDYSIHNDNNSIEISYKCAGEYNAIIPAVETVADIVSLSYLFKERAIFKHSYRINKQSTFVKISSKDLDRANRITSLEPFEIRNDQND